MNSTLDVAGDFSVSVTLLELGCSKVNLKLFVLFLNLLSGFRPDVSRGLFIPHH